MLKHSILGLLFMCGLVAVAQDDDFGKYEEPVVGSANVLSNDYEQDTIILNQLHPDSIREDGYYVEHYASTPYSSGAKKMEGYIKNGKPEGKWVLYSNLRIVFYVGNYVNGVKEGKWRGMYFSRRFEDVKREDTVTCWEGSFSNGKLYGKVTEYEYGHVSRTSNYINGLQEGEQLDYNMNYRQVSDNKDGTQRETEVEDFSVGEISNYHNGKLSGLVMSFPEANRKYEHYLDGKKDGQCIYYADANIVAIINYKQGLYDGYYSKFYNSGRLAYAIEFKNGLPYNAIDAFSDSGKKLDAGSLKEGNGVLKMYYDNGSPKSVCVYRNQTPNGEIIYYNDSGKTTLQGTIVTEEDTSVHQINGTTIYDDNINSYIGKLCRLLPGTDIKEFFDNGKLQFSYYTMAADSFGNKNVTTYRCYNDKGRLTEEYSAISHCMVGVDRNYSDSGLSSYIYYKVSYHKGKTEGVKDGICRYYYKSGRLKAEIQYTNGAVTGHSRYYKANGDLIREYVIMPDNSSLNIFNKDTVNRIDSKGRKQGKWISIGVLSYYYFLSDNYEDTVATSIDYYRNGKPVGVWIDDRLSDGSFLQKINWQDSINGYKYEYRFGKISGEGPVKCEYTMILRNGHWKYYNVDTKKYYLDSEGEYKQDEAVGVWKRYKKNGKLKEVVDYDKQKLENEIEFPKRLGH